MSSRVVAYLNLIIEAPTPHTHLTPSDARLALQKIEGHDLAVNALRQIVEHPKNAEAIAHAARYLKLHDEYQAKHSQAHAVSHPLPYDGVANRAQYEAEAAHAAQAEPDDGSPNPVDVASAKNPVDDQDVADLV